MFQDNDALVRRSVQTTDTRCGAACCVMIFDYFSMSITEDASAESIRTYESEPGDWWADPEAVAKSLDASWTPDNIKDQMCVKSFISSDVLCNWIANTIIKKDIPVIVLVYGGAHWIVVDGVRWQEVNGNFQLVGFQIVDPYEHEPSRRFVPLAAFLRRYADPNEFGQRWAGQHISVGPADETTLLPVVQTRFRQPNWICQFISNVPFGNKIISSSKLASRTAAITQLEAMGFHDLKAPRGGGSAATTIRLHGHDAGDTLLVMLQQNNSTSLWAAIDTNTAEVIEVTSNIDMLLDLMKIDVEQISQFQDSSAVISDELYWRMGPMSSGGFSGFRKITVDNSEYFIFPGGRILDHFPEFTKGGG